MRMIFGIAAMLILLAAVAQAASTNRSYSLNIFGSLINFINTLINDIFGSISPPVCNLPNIPVGCTWIPAPGSGAPCAGHIECTTSTTTLKPTTTSLYTTMPTTSSSTFSSTTIPQTTSTVSTTTSTSTTTIYTTSTTTSSTTTVPQGQIICKNDQYLAVNQSMSCSAVSLTLVDVVVGSERYEIFNAIINVSLNGAIQFENLSLAQNLTTPYWLNFANGQSLEVYVYDANYNDYPVFRYANISMIYR